MIVDNGKYSKNQCKMFLIFLPVVCMFLLELILRCKTYDLFVALFP